MSDNIEKPELTENEVKTRSVVKEFIQEYKRKSADESNAAWLNRQFARYPELWPDAVSREKDATEIVESVERYQRNKAELDEHLSQGGSHEKYIISKIEASAAAVGALNVGEYVGKIDSAISQANAQMHDAIFKKAGGLNENPQLKGFIMEADQTASFNVDSAVKESTLQAVRPDVNTKNSVDIKIVDAQPDGSATLIHKYQSKCCETAAKAEKNFQKGAYNGQQKLVTQGQTDDVRNSTDHLEADGVTSKSHTHDEYKAMQEKAQKEGQIPEYDWSNANKVAIAKSIGKKAAWAGVMAVGFQAARILGRRAWNWITGKENPSAEEDLKEFVTSSIQSAGGASVAVAVTGGVTVAVKSGWVGKALRGTPVGTIANAVCIGIENVKILYKLGKGEITGAEALDQAGNATCSLLGGMAGGAKGAAIGASLGATLGPVGAAIGGVAGAVVGGIAGSTVGEMIYSGAKKAVKAVGSAIASVGNAIGNGIKSIGRGLASLFGF